MGSHRNFIFDMNMQICLWYMVITFLVILTCSFKLQAFWYFSLIFSHIHIDQNRNFIFGMNIHIYVPNIISYCLTVSSGGSRISHWGGVPTRWGGHQPPTRTLFSENVCKNERNGSCWGGARRRHPPLDPPMVRAITFISHGMGNNDISRAIRRERYVNTGVS